MSAMREYTLWIFKTDKRTKEGRRLIEVRDFAPITEAAIASVADGIRENGFIVEVFATYVTKRNLMSGQEFQERHDTPYYCSPSSESYWSN